MRNIKSRNSLTSRQSSKKPIKSSNWESIYNITSDNSNEASVFSGSKRMSSNKRS